MKKRKTLIKMAALLLLAAVLCGCQKQEEMAVLAEKEGEPELINIAKELPRAGEAKLIEGLWETKDGTLTTEGEANIKDLIQLKVAVVGELDAELLRMAEEELNQQGYGVEILLSKDYEEPNRMLETGEVDANFFQHQAYLERYNQEKKTLLTNLGTVYDEPVGIYPGKLSSLSDIVFGSKIAVSANPTEYARALLLLQQEGILVLAEDTDLMAVWEDVQENPYGIEVVSMEEEELMASLPRVDLAVFSVRQALVWGENPQAFLAMEAEDSLAAEQLGRIFVTTAGVKKQREEIEQEGIEKKEETEKLEEEKGNRAKEAVIEDGLSALLSVLKSEEMEKLVSEKYLDSIRILE